MKLDKMTFAALVLFLAPNVFAGPSKVTAQLGKIYVADGFDANDNVQIVGTGVYNNSCYRNAETEVKVDHEKKTITLIPRAYKYDGLCLQVILPFERVIDVGLLKKGEYSLVQEGQVGVLGKIGVRANVTEAPDDFQYAPISQAFFQSKNGQNKVYLTGDFPSRCLRLKEIRTQVQTDVLLVQPIVEVDPNIPCTVEKSHYEAVAEVGPMAPGRYLLHVRSMNGKAVNNLVEVP